MDRFGQEGSHGASTRFAGRHGGASGALLGLLGWKELGRAPVWLADAAAIETVQLQTDK
jgi:hypothetical protein